MRMAASKVCWRCRASSADCRSPWGGRRRRSPVLKVATLYRQFTSARSGRALLRDPRIWGGDGGR